MCNLRRRPQRRSRGEGKRRRRAAASQACLSDACAAGQRPWHRHLSQGHAPGQALDTLLDRLSTGGGPDENDKSTHFGVAIDGGHNRRARLLGGAGEEVEEEEEEEEEGESVSRGVVAAVHATGRWERKRGEGRAGGQAHRLGVGEGRHTSSWAWERAGGHTHTHTHTHKLDYGANRRAPTEPPPSIPAAPRLLASLTVVVTGKRGAIGKYGASRESPAKCGDTGKSRESLASLESHWQVWRVTGKSGESLASLETLASLESHWQVWRVTGNLHPPGELAASLEPLASMESLASTESSASLQSPAKSIAPKHALPAGTEWTRDEPKRSGSGSGGRAGGRAGNCPMPSNAPPSATSSSNPKAQRSRGHGIPAFAFLLGPPGNTHTHTHTHTHTPTPDTSHQPHTVQKSAHFSRIWVASFFFFLFWLPRCWDALPDGASSLSLSLSLSLSFLVLVFVPVLASGPLATPVPRLLSRLDRPLSFPRPPT
ncbi:hypothetical protein PMIN01_10191 [Paraphaeosphaeria minitans]|uniref:Uncharacterized protein n=1 Tax=Paraphaeosphaeria minitans TaxID=565426 RepID=A0A9P6KMS0_9PLEO|nr:hypothetical protein PMIN01_10191 [Paraphaeosphaeria minitans]